MPRKKKDSSIAPAATGTTDAPSVPKRTIIRAKSTTEWSRLLKKAEEGAWRKLRVIIQLREWLMAGKPASLDAANAMLKARGLEDQMEAVADIVDPDERAKAAERIATDEGLCEFSRRQGRPGIWMPSNNIKAMLKENWSVLGLRQKVRGSRGALAEGLFVWGVAPSHVDANDPVEREWVYLGQEPTGVHTAVSHSIGPSGPVHAIKRHEYVDKARIEFDVIIASANSVNEKISDDELAATLVHASEHGLGACRSQGFGRFHIVSVEEIDAADVENPQDSEDSDSEAVA